MFLNDKIMKKTRVFPLIFFILLTLYISPATASDIFKTGYTCYYADGTQRWFANTEIKHKQGDVYILAESGEGNYSGFDVKVSWLAELEFESNESIVKPLRMKKYVFNEHGDALVNESQEFDFDKNIVTCVRENIPEKSFKTKKFKFDKDMVNRLLLGLYIQKLLEQGKSQHKVQMVTGEPGFYNIEIKIVDEEIVEINGKAVKAYKICLDPTLGIFDFVKIFLPKAYVWHSANPNFEWLMYKGLEGDINSPRVEVVTKERITS